MRKDKRNLLILFVIVILVVFSSYFLFASGITGKLKGNVLKLDASLNDEVNASFLPVITMVINSSGEKIVNSDVAVTIIAESNYKIDKVYYSFDMKNWTNATIENKGSDNITAKIVFDRTMNEIVYIVAENERGYKSYAYKTLVNIDKETPYIGVNKTTLIASDNVGLSKVQYSNDKVNWDSTYITGTETTLSKDVSYSYVRVVDLAGNISEIKEIR